MGVGRGYTPGRPDPLESPETDLKARDQPRGGRARVSLRADLPPPHGLDTPSPCGRAWGFKCPLPFSHASSRPAVCWCAASTAPAVAQDSDSRRTPRRRHGHAHGDPDRGGSRLGHRHRSRADRPQPRGRRGRPAALPRRARHRTQRRARPDDLAFHPRCGEQPHAGDGRRSADQPGHDRAASRCRISRPDLIERIEVIKGPRSALYGTDAIGGVVNIITRRGSRDGWSASLGYGDYETTEASVVGGLSGDAGALDLGVSWIESDGFPTRSDDTLNRGFDNLSLSLGGSTTVGAAGPHGAGLARRRQHRVFGFLPRSGRPGLRQHDGVAGRRDRDRSRGRLTITAARCKTIRADPVARLSRDSEV